MPRLILMRHAKSSWEEPDRDDFDRPLAPRGKKAAVAVARALSARHLLPQRLVASSARRCRDTLAHLLPFLDDDTDIRLTRDLYMASEDHHIDVIRANGGNARTLMVLGHNPALQELALVLAGAGPARAALLKDFPTAAVAVIDFETPRWTDIEPGEGVVAAVLTPQLLKRERA